MVSGPSPMPIDRTVRTPCCQARCSSSSRSASYRGLSRCACESTSTKSFNRLFEPGAYFDIFQKAGQAGFSLCPDRSRYDHSIGLQAAQLSRLQIGDDDYLASDEFFGLVGLGDTGNNLPHFVADIYFKAQKPIGALDPLSYLHLSDA